MKILKSFSCAARGIRYCINNERNVRIHFVAALYVFVFSCFFQLTKSQVAVLILTVFSVITAEMLNTAVEGLSDIFVSEYNVAAKNIKDIAAGAVFVSAIGSIFVGLTLFSDVGAYLRVYDFFCSHPSALAILVVSVIISALYIYLGPIEVMLKIKNILKKNQVGN